MSIDLPGTTAAVARGGSGSRNAVAAQDNIETHRFFIDGQWQRGSTLEPLEDRNPFNGETFALIEQADSADARRAVDAAHRAAAGWARLTVAERTGYMMRAIPAIEKRIPMLREILVCESGSSIPKAMFEIGYGIELLQSAAADIRYIFGETLPQTQPGQFGMTIRQPLGVIAGISPFNAPFLLAFKKVVLALAAGNTFVLKPSEETPLIALKIAEIFEDAGLPDGVLNVIPGPAEAIADVFFTDPRVRMVTFTGSTRVGNALAVRAAENMKRITLELGGKNPLIVLADADVDYAVRAACFGIFFHQGQVCMANSRILIADEIYDEFCHKLVARAREYRSGDPAHEGVIIGPLIRPSQCASIDLQITDAKAKGATILEGGVHDGRTYQPTIVAGVTEEMSLYQEETFGPVVSLIRIKDADDALRVANSTSYGLSSAVITNNLQQAMDLALRLEAGMVHINDSTVSDEPHVPFGGIKDSGMGREGGRYSMAEMTELKWITIQLGERQFPL